MPITYPYNPLPLPPTSRIDYGNHLDLNQFWHVSLMKGMCSTTRSVTFRFVWYEIVEDPGQDIGQHSGGLYRDDSGRKLQLQSFLVSDLIA
jgi:hypothetical protein